MQKNDKVNAFLLSHSSRSRIYIKKVAFSNSLVHFGSIAIFLILGISTLGVGLVSIIKDSGFVEVVAKASAVTQVSAETLSSSMIAGTDADASNEMQAASAGEYVPNSGGPAETEQIGTGDPQLDGKVLDLRQTADPASLPTMWAHLGKINNEFGFRRNPFGGRAYEFHPGMDIDGERGDAVVAAASGTIITAGYKGGYGNFVEIDHGNGLTTRYGHMSKLDAEAGQTITRGTTLGYVGSTGRSTGPHLHFELRLNDRPINPRLFLPQEPTELDSIAR